MKFISEATIIFLEAAALGLLLFVGYIAFLRVRIERQAFAEVRYPLLRAAGFIAVCAVVLEAARYFANKGEILTAFAALSAGILGCIVIWFAAVRQSLNDDRIRYALIVLAALSQLTCLFLFMMWWAGDNMTVDDKFNIDGQMLAQMINNAMQVIGVVIAAAMIVVTNLFNAREADKNTRHQIYQTLELQSIELFRFEADHPELVEAFWFSEEEDNWRATREKRLLAYQTRQYVCQMLNLFEMSFRFRKEGIVPAEVFGSWAIWMWELCEEPNFAAMWRDEAGLRLNYVADFRQAIDIGVEIAEAARSLPENEAEAQANARRDQFAEKVAALIGGCTVLGQWFDDAPAPRMQAKPAALAAPA